MGKLFEKADSLAYAGTEYAGAVRTTKDREVAEEASYGSLGLLFKTGGADSAIGSGSRFLAEYPSSAHAAEVLSKLGDIAMNAKIPARPPRFTRDSRGSLATRRSPPGAGKARRAPGRSRGKRSSAPGVFRNTAAAEGRPPGGRKGSPSIYLSLGKLNREAGNSREAKRFLMAALEQEQSGPIAGEAYTTLGLIYRAEGLSEIATSYFRQAASASPGAGVTRDIADMLFESNDYREPQGIRTSLRRGSGRHRTAILRLQDRRRMIRNEEDRRRRRPLRHLHQSTGMTGTTPRCSSSKRDCCSFAMKNSPAR